MGEICITDGIWLRQAETKNLKVLKYLNQDSREAGNIKCRMHIDKFTFCYRRLWKDTNCGQQDWNCNIKEYYEDCEINREKLEIIFKNLKMVKRQKKVTYLLNCTKRIRKLYKITGISKYNFCIRDNTSGMELCGSSANVWKLYRKHPKTYTGINLLNPSYKIYTKVKVNVIPQQAELVQGLSGRLTSRIFVTFDTTRVEGRQP